MSLLDTREKGGREGTSHILSGNRWEVGGGVCGAAVMRQHQKHPDLYHCTKPGIKFFKIDIGSIHLFHSGEMSLHEKILSVKPEGTTAWLPLHYRESNSDFPRNAVLI